MKNILLVFSGMVIMYVICLGNSTKELKDYTEQISEITDAYEQTIDDVKTQLEKARKDNEKLSTQLYELEEEVWNVINNEEYNITINHDGETHTYKYTKDGLFGNKEHYVTN